MAIKISNTTVIDNGRNIAGVAVTASSVLNVPSGDTASRPGTPGTGSIRYNSEFSILEYYDGVNWIPLKSSADPGNFSSNGLIIASSGNASGNVVQRINISSTGNTSYFGTSAGSSGAFSYRTSCCSNSIRGVFAGGETPTPSYLSEIYYNNMITSGTSRFFGDLTVVRSRGTGISNSTRGVFIGATPANVMDYITIASGGDATDFGDATITSTGQHACGISSPTRGLFNNQGTPIHYITTSSTGNSILFGNMTPSRSPTTGGINGACSSSTRGLFAGGIAPPAIVYNVIDYVTIASTGDTTDFGDLTSNRSNMYGGLSNSTRGVFAGGNSPTPGGTVNTMDYVTIASTGDAIDFGDLRGPTSTGIRCCTLSAGHGGLS